MIKLEVTLSGAADLQGRLRALGAAAPVAVMRAVNRTAATGRTRSIRLLTKATGLARKTVAPSVAVRRATPETGEASIRFTGRRIPLIRFARAARPGRPVTIPDDLTVTPDLPTPAFAQRMPRSGHLGIFKRRTTKHLPISELRGPSIPELIASRIPGLALELTPDLRKNLEHEIDFLVSGGRRAG